ncbi:phosphotransferase enzyme family protein [Pseudonocardia pini]|uniref:phosphotransferase enzyme family protein n=1 Tax=Pseudonocardia pini TaxID=2758030 RepID=UPI0015F0C46B|nr:aminoglycoside phosphotransferase family protein [Pseudonocardia pini]
MSTQQGRTFGRESATRTMQLACEAVGLSSEDAELIRLGENAIFRAGQPPVIVRIARGPAFRDSARKEVAVARWLEDEGIRAARVWSIKDEQPLEVDGSPVTFWEFLDGRRGSPDDIVSLAGILRDLHSRAVPRSFDLSAEDILGRVLPRIESSPIPDDDRRYLTDLVTELREAVAGLSFPLDVAVTHGDAHVQNLMVVDEQPILIDFERVAVGQPEWDLAMTATEYATAGWWSAEQYQAFSDRYGFDVMTWSGFDVLRRVHELKMTTWLMQNVRESDEICAEFQLRMRAIRGSGDAGEWRPF